MAVIPGHVKQEVVLLGCHRDAWVLGAGDPISGTAAIVEVVKGLGALLRKGWRPLRTLLIASWDAEEVELPTLVNSFILTQLSSPVLLALQSLAKILRTF